MVGGAREGFDIASPLLEDMAVDEKAVHYVGPSPSGHFVKLVHNAIEFGMVQAIAEGVAMLRGFDHHLDLPALFEHWNHGTVIRSWLVELMGKGLTEGGIGLSDHMPPDPSQMSTYVEDTDEVKWVVTWAIDHDIPVPVTGMSQQMLMAYRDLDWPAAKSVALLRNQYGGHPIVRVDEEEERRSSRRSRRPSNALVAWTCSSTTPESACERSTRGSSPIPGRSGRSRRADSTTSSRPDSTDRSSSLGRSSRGCSRPAAAAS